MLSPPASHVSPNTCVNRGHDLTDYFIDILRDDSFWSLYRIEKSIRDGHCFIHSLATCLAHMYDIDVSVYWLLKKLKDECITNHNHYLPSMVGGKTWFFNQMHSYIMHKTFYSSFCGILPYIMANASNENIIIIEKKCFWSFSIECIAVGWW